MKAGEIYRLELPWIGWARVLPMPANVSKCEIEGEPAYLIETLFLKRRWWVTAKGKPNNHRSPWLVINQQNGKLADGR